MSKLFELRFNLNDMDDVDTFKETYKEVIIISSHNTLLIIKTKPKYLEEVLEDLIKVYGITNIDMGML